MSTLVRNIITNAITKEEINVLYIMHNMKFLPKLISSKHHYYILTQMQLPKKEHLQIIQNANTVINNVNLIISDLNLPIDKVLNLSSSFHVPLVILFGEPAQNIRAEGVYMLNRHMRNIAKIYISDKAKQGWNFSNNIYDASNFDETLTDLSNKAFIRNNENISYAPELKNRMSLPGVSG